MELDRHSLMTAISDQVSVGAARTRTCCRNGQKGGKLSSQGSEDSV